MMDAGNAKDWQRLRTDVRRLLGRRAPSEADAEDIVQEVLLRIWRHAASVRDDERFGAWVRRIVDTTLVDHLRTRQRHPLTRTAVSVEKADHDTDEAQHPSPRPLVAAILRPFVESLDEPYRQVIEWSELEGKPHAAIAARLGLSVSAVKSRVQRGRAQLRARLVRCCAIALDARNGVMGCEQRPDAEVPPGCCAAGTLATPGDGGAADSGHSQVACTGPPIGT